MTNRTKIIVGLLVVCAFCILLFGAKNSKKNNVIKNGTSEEKNIMSAFDTLDDNGNTTNTSNTLNETNNEAYNNSSADNNIKDTNNIINFQNNESVENDGFVDDIRY